MATISTIGKEDFRTEVLENNKVVLVDFWAPWCPPCRMMAPILENIADKYADTVSVVKVNVDESADNQRIAAEHGVSGIPNMQLFKNGQVVDELIGARPQDVLEEEITKQLA